MEYDGRLGVGRLVREVLWWKGVCRRPTTDEAQNGVSPNAPRKTAHRFAGIEVDRYEERRGVAQEALQNTAR